MADDAPLPPIEVDLDPLPEDDWVGPLLTAHDVVAAVAQLSAVQQPAVPRTDAARGASRSTR